MGWFGDDEAVRAPTESGPEEEGLNGVARSLLVGIFLVVIGLVLLLWLTMQLGSLLTHFYWIPFNQGFSALPEAIPALPGNLLDPAAAWPAALQPVLPPGIVFWVLFLLLARYGWRVGRRLVRAFSGMLRTDHSGETRWAVLEDLRSIDLPTGAARALRRVLRRAGLRVRTAEEMGVILGTGPIPPPKRRARGNRDEMGQRMAPKSLLAVENQQSHTLVVAGTRSGKTAGLCIPALLTWEGAVIATSVKNDLIDQTIDRRRQMGKVYVFDPVAATNAPSMGWTPIATAGDWREAQRTAASLVEVAMGKDGGGGGNMQFFANMAKQTLPCLLHAAALSGGSMRDVVRWLHRINDKPIQREIDAALRRSPAGKGVQDAWKGFVTKEAKLRGDIAATIASALVSYEDERIQVNAERCDIIPAEFFNGEPNTLYVVAPMAEQSRLEPVFVALMQSLLMWVTEQPTKLSCPLLCVLDEAANIAALPLLPEMLATIGSQNVQILTAWQDFSQIQARYGDKKNTILNNSRAKLVLPGVSDPETIRFFSDVAGETSESSVSVQRGDHTGSSRSKTFSSQRRAILNAATIREQKFGEGILVYGQLPPARVKLRMYFRDPALKRLGAGQAVPPGPSWLWPLTGRFIKAPPAVAGLDVPTLPAGSAPAPGGVPAPGDVPAATFVPPPMPATPPAVAPVAAPGASLRPRPGQRLWAELDRRQDA